MTRHFQDAGITRNPDDVYYAEVAECERIRPRPSTLGVRCCPECGAPVHAILRMDGSSIVGCVGCDKEGAKTYHQPVEEVF